MKKYLLLVAVFIVASISGQRFCGTDEKMKDFFANNPDALAKKQDLRNF